jgi:hypothetical protein
MAGKVRLGGRQRAGQLADLGFQIVDLRLQRHDLDALAVAFGPLGGMFAGEFAIGCLACRQRLARLPDVAAQGRDRRLGGFQAVLERGLRAFQAENARRARVQFAVEVADALVAARDLGGMAVGGIAQLLRLDLDAAHGQRILRPQLVLVRLDLGHGQRHGILDPPGRQPHRPPPDSAHQGERQDRRRQEAQREDHGDLDGHGCSTPSSNGCRLRRRAATRSAMRKRPRIVPRPLKSVS